MIYMTERNASTAAETITVRTAASRAITDKAMSKSTFGTMIYRLLLLALLLPLSIITGADIGFRLGFVDPETENWFVVLQLTMGACFLLAVGLCLGIDRMVHARQPKVRRMLRLTMAGLLAGVLALLGWDPPAQKFPFGWEDVPATAPEGLAAYERLAGFLKNREALGDLHISREDFEKLTRAPQAHASAIQAGWEKVADARAVVDALDRYAQIADLSTPESAIEQTNMPFVYLSRYYRAHALLLAAQGQFEEGIAQLGRIYAVACKALPYTRYLIRKIIWMAVAEGCLDTARRIARHPRAGPAAWKALHTHFPPLDADAVTFRGALISETMFMLNSLAELERSEIVDSEFCQSISYGGLCDQGWNRGVLNALAFLSYKPQATKNRLQQYMVALIEACSMHPPAIVALQSYAARFKRLRPGNALGWIVLQSPFEDFTRYPQRGARVKVQSDLLYLYLNARLGDARTLPDYLCEGNYRPAGKPGVYKSAGWDCLADTDDDIAFLTVP